MDLVSLSYVSLARIPRHSVEMLDIMRAALDRNERLGITGVLFFAGDHFYQVLEGDAQAVTALFDRIAQDRRHCCVKRLGVVPIGERRFAEWAMRFLDEGRVPELRHRFPAEALFADSPNAVARVEHALAQS
mgnify:CR=1 FL=1